MSSWHTQAVCRDMDPELFFPASDDLAGREEAIAVCGPCPVHAECLAEAGLFGVWGGEYFGPNEDATPAGRPRKQREHGTPTGYRQHLRDGDAVCDPCRDAARLEWNSRKDAKRAAKLADAEAVRA